MSLGTQFLSNKPCGLDLFDGQSQDKVACAIMKHIKSVDAQSDPTDPKEMAKALPRIIGIEGSWGAGKSNTILQLEEKLKGDYYSLPMTHGEIRRICSVGHYWNS